MQKIIEIIGAIPQHRDFRLAQPVDFSISTGERIAVCGDNGGGKTKFINLLTNNFPLSKGCIIYSFDTSTERVSDNIRCVTFQDVSGGAAPDYYQQRYNRGDLADSYATVKNVIESKCKTLNEEHLSLIKHLGLDDLWEKPLIFLSSGELRKVQIGKQLLSLPKLLIIDNPYIGLDVEARMMLNNIFNNLPPEIALITVVCRKEDIPPCCTHVVSVAKESVGEKLTKDEYLSCMAQQTPDAMTPEENVLLNELAELGENPECDNILSFRDICI